MSTNTKRKWRAASPAHPCPVCGSKKRCGAAEDGNAWTCYKQGDHPTYGTGAQRTTKNGEPYFLFRTGPPPGEKAPLPLYSHTDGAASPATDAEADRVYRAFLKLLPKSAKVCEVLESRGVPDGSRLRSWYKVLPLRGRAQVCRRMVADGLEPLMARTPGFFVRTPDKGAPYWTCSGKPGLVVPVTAAGLVVGVIIRPDPTGEGGKYLWFSAKRHGGAKCQQRVHVPVWSGDTTTVRLTEGVLKADVATELGGVLTVGLSGLYSKKVVAALSDLKVKTVRLAFDADANTNPDVARAVALHHKRLTGAGFVVELERWDAKDGKGIDDLLAAGKAPELVTGTAAADVIGAFVRTAAATATGGRVAILVTDHLADMRRKVVAALVERDPDLYQSAGKLVTIAAPSGPRPAPASVITLTAPTILDRISDVVMFFQEKGAGEQRAIKVVNPPDTLAAAVRDLGSWPGVRTLIGVTTAPILRPDGTVHQTPGYDLATALVYSPVSEFDPIPANPTRDDAVRALARLKGGVGQFPWQETSDLSAWLAEVLTLTVRAAINGPAPGFFHTANTAGSGKTTLARAAAWIGTGADLPSAPYPLAGRRGEKDEDVEEVRKQGSACAIAGHAAFLFDNVPSGFNFGSGVMDAILTSTTDAGRQLGTSSSVPRDMRTVWLWSGNNITPKADTGRRVIPVRLYTSEEQPEERQFTGPDVEVWARTERRSLFVAALTVAAAYIRAGRPVTKTPPMGSFQAWSDLVRAALIWAGEPDPCAHRKTVIADDPDRQTNLCLMTLLVTVGATGEHPMTVKEIADAVKSELSTSRPVGVSETGWHLDHVPSACRRVEAYRAVFPTHKQPNPALLGYALRKYRGRVLDRMRIEQRGLDRDKIALWAVREVESTQ